MYEVKDRLFYYTWWFSISLEVEISDTGCSVNDGGRVCCSFSMHEGIDSYATFIVGTAKCIFFKSSVAHMACTVFEDNQGAIALAKVLTMMPHSKHIAIPYHFFIEYVRRKKIDGVHVATNNQLVDMLTKGLVQVKFEKLRKMPMGW